MIATRECEICGAVIVTRVPADWHPRKLERWAERDLQDHLQGHSFAEVLRYEVRKDPSQVPADERPGIVRDIYRQLLGVTDENGRFTLGWEDGVGLYSIDEVLGSACIYHLWRGALRCSSPRCGCRKALPPASA